MNQEYSLPGIESRITQLENELRQAKAQKEKLEERCVLLLGRFVLEQIRKARGSITVAETLELGLGGIRFAEWLTHDEDRWLFDLPALPVSTSTGP